MPSRPPSPAPQSREYAVAAQADQPTPPSSHHSRSGSQSDSVFGSHSPSPQRSRPATNELIDASDLPAVKRQHMTDGYRAGISAGKANETTAQAGFDEGYPIGAHLGLRVGMILGRLAEHVRSTKSNPSRASKQSGDQNAAAAVARLELATHELKIEVLLDEMRERGMLGKSVEEIEEAKEQGLSDLQEEWSLPFKQINDIDLLRKWEMETGIREEAG